MIFKGLRLCALLLGLLPAAAAAEPIHLKLAFYESDHTAVYLYGIKPFVDSVNAEGQGLIAIDVYTDGALGAALAQQPRLVLDGEADIAFVIPGQTPYRFPDNELLELPGLFRGVRDGTLAYTHLIASHALRGYQDFFVIGAYTTGPNGIHSRKPIESLEALKGQKIRANNSTEAAALERLGVVPTVLPVPKVAAAVEKGALDGTASAPTAMFDYDIMPVTKNHYFLRSGVNPLVLVMSRKKFDSLPDAAKALIRKYSGDRAAATWIETYGANERRLLDRIKSDPQHKSISPSPSDAEAVRKLFQSQVEAWAAKSARNRELLKMTEAELAKIRSPK